LTFFEGQLAPELQQEINALQFDVLYRAGLLPLKPDAKEEELDPLRTVGSPAAQNRPEFRLKTHTTQGSVSFAPTSGQGRLADLQFSALRLATRCESPRAVLVDGWSRPGYTEDDSLGGQKHHGSLARSCHHPYRC
jgi:hypothetical protein